MKNNLKYTVLIGGSILLGSLFLKNPEKTAMKNILENSREMFNSGKYQGFKASAGYNENSKVAKIYSPIKKSSEGEYFFDMVGAVDMNGDGKFQKEELVDARTTHKGYAISMGNCPEKLGGTISQFGNTYSLERIFEEINK